jgi:hypothetical protein
MDAFTDMLAVRGCGSSDTIFLELWELCCWLGIRMKDPRSTIPQSSVFPVSTPHGKSQSIKLT